MLGVVQVLAVIFVGITTVPAVAYVLEFPGKMRLTQDVYFAVQKIYYPGFTIAGIAEPLGLLATFILLLLTPPRTEAFWLTFVALVGLIGMQAVYWLVTHRVNRLWLQGQTLGGLGSGFFSFASGRRSEARPAGWTDLRDRWEYSHLARAVLAVLSLVALVIAIS
jgi:hypothetical protein